MIPIIATLDRYCALTPYTLTAPADCANALIGEWFGEDITGNSSGIIFSSPYNLSTDVTVPNEGTFVFWFRCCE